jgi:hypothetical protein
MPNNGQYGVEVLKSFAPENGGGTETFKEVGGASLHHALDVARGMVTFIPARNYAHALALCTGSREVTVEDGDKVESYTTGVR